MYCSVGGIASIVGKHKTDLVLHNKEINGVNVKHVSVHANVVQYRQAKNVICDIHVPHYW